MTGFVLAAGFGTRLRPLTDHIPKALVSVCGHPLFEYSLDFLRRHQVVQMAANTHYLSEQVVGFVSGNNHGVELFHEAGRIRGTAGGLWGARDFLSSDPIALVCNVDILYCGDVTPVVDSFLESDALATLVATPVHPNDAGTILYNRSTMDYEGVAGGTGVRHGFDEANFCGLTIYRSSFFELLTQDDFSIIDVWDRVRGRGGKITVSLCPALRWFDIGTPRALLGIHQEVLKGNCDLPLPHGYRIDHHCQCALPRGSSAAVPSGWKLTWSDSADPGSESHLNQCLVLATTEIDAHARHTASILSPWGVIATDDSH